MDAEIGLTRGVTSVLQTGVLRRYLLVTFLVVAAAVVLPQVFAGDGGGFAMQMPPINLLVWSVILLALAGGLVVMIS